jgi:hypothetical protein
MGTRKTAQPVYEGRYAAEVEKRAYSQRGLNRAIPFDARIRFVVRSDCVLCN